MTSTKRLPAILVTTGIFSWILVAIGFFHEKVIFLLYACLCCWQYYSWISIKCREGQQVLITATVFLITTIGFLITSSLTLTSETKDIIEATQQKSKKRGKHNEPCAPEMTDISASGDIEYISEIAFSTESLDED